MSPEIILFVKRMLEFTIWSTPHYSVIGLKMLPLDSFSSFSNEFPWRKYEIEIPETEIHLIYSRSCYSKTSGYLDMNFLVYCLFYLPNWGFFPKMQNVFPKSIVRVKDCFWESNFERIFDIDKNNSLCTFLRSSFSLTPYFPNWFAVLTIAPIQWDFVF